MNAFNSELVEPAGRHFAGSQALLSVELLLHILDAGLRAVMLVIRAVVVEDVESKVSSPGLGISFTVAKRSTGAVRFHDLHNLAIRKKGEEVRR